MSMPASSGNAESNELERGALGGLDGLRDLEQLQVDWLVGAEQLPGGDPEQQRVADLPGGAGDGDGGGHASRLGPRSAACHHLIRCSAAAPPSSCSGSSGSASACIRRGSSILFLWIIWLHGLVRGRDHRQPARASSPRSSPRSCSSARSSLHELGHAFAARREGIGVGGIDLFFFGGFMRADARQRDAGRGVPRRRGRPGGDARCWRSVFGGVGVALLGRRRCCDAATFELRVGLDCSRCWSPSPRSPTPALFVLNMVPAFPLDGGRIARAIVWRLTRRPPQGDQALAPTSARRSPR